jgi:putative transposase
VLSEHGVPIAPRTFYAWVKRAPSKRALWDATIAEILAGYYEPGTTVGASRSRCTGR